MSSFIFETYKNYLILHGLNIYQTAYDMSMDTMCANPLFQHLLSHWKCVFCCCTNCPCISIPSQETYKNHPSTCPTLNFHV